ncbi:hypothetical protein PGT21_004602 [Puccinia graminis f. sp. tritici]|uniref:Uncharacterized protein n=1 Tax=Puccinia graminis f. sp. tritici TaxID=56615 RepID=A0A5B0PX27_PUCGR|nr:hypothetical protein PGT21_004602 [Puccinia graminis f. sp. tritici]
MKNVPKVVAGNQQVDCAARCNLSFYKKVCSDVVQTRNLVIRDAVASVGEPARIEMRFLFFQNTVNPNLTKSLLAVDPMACPKGPSAGGSLRDGVPPPTEGLG